MSAPVARTNRPGTAPRPGATQTTREQLDELDALLQRMLQLPVSDGDAEPAPRAAQPAPPPPPQPALPRPVRPTPPPKRAYPPSYMVVETATPPYLEQMPANLEPRRIEPQQEPAIEAPTPGGRHDLVEDAPEDPIGDLARLRARMESQEGDWVPLRSSWQPSAQTWKPLADTWQQTARTPEPMPTLPPEPSLPPNPPAVTVRQETASVFPPVIPVAPPEPPAATVPAPPQYVPPRRPLILMPVVLFNQTFDLFLWPLGPVGTWLKGRSGRGFLGTVGFLCLLGAAALAVADGLGWTR